MRRKRTSLFLLTTVVLASLSLAPAATAAGTCWEATKLEKRFAGKVNFRRTQANVAKLRLDPELSMVARTHSLEMKRAQEPFHSSIEQLSTRVTRWTVLAENVGAGMTVKSIWRQLQDGALHESNIVDTRFRFMGVGVAKDGDRKFVTLVFEGTRDPGTTLKMPSC